jgi:hypothetical protein
MKFIIKLIYDVILIKNFTKFIIKLIYDVILIKIFTKFIIKLITKINYLKKLNFKDLTHNIIYIYINIINNKIYNLYKFRKWNNKFNKIFSKNN